MTYNPPPAPNAPTENIIVIDKKSGAEPTTDGSADKPDSDELK